MHALNAISANSSNGKSYLKVSFSPVFFGSVKQLRRGLKKVHDGVKAPFIRAICFYQRHLSRHTCLYTPTCSEYTKRCINNFGVIFGVLLGAYRILRCNPLSKGGTDPAPEWWHKKKWLI